MRTRETIIVLALVLSLSIMPAFAVRPITAATQGPAYTERMDVFTAGTNAYWQMTFNQFNRTIPAITSVDSTSGLSAYRLVALSTSKAVSDDQAFGTDGYNILKVPFLPSSGVFLTVNATSSSSAGSVAAAFQAYLGTNFTLVGSHGNSFTYFGSGDFATVTEPALYELLPSHQGGFASLLSQGAFRNSSMPSIVVSGVSNGSGFTHSFTLGEAASGVLSSSDGLNMEALLGTNATVRASNSSTSSEFFVHSLDGLVFSADHATITNTQSTFSGSYMLGVSAGQAVKPNVTIETQPPTVYAYRVLQKFNSGYVANGQTVAVSIVIKNSGTAGTVQNLTLNDDWWKSYPGLFQLENGSSTISVSSLAAGSTQSFTYVLKVISSTAADIIVPKAIAAYSYTLSGQTFKGRAALNQAELQVNNQGTALSVYIVPNVSTGNPIGKAANYTVNISNAGSAPALNLTLGTFRQATLVQGTSVAPFDIAINYTSLTQSNYTQMFTLTWRTADGKAENLTTNSVSLVFSHTQMVIPFLQLTTSDTLSAASLSTRSMNVTYTLSDSGLANITSADLNQSFPSGVVCSKAYTGNGTCGNGSFTISGVPTATKGTHTSTIGITFAQDNYIVPPASAVTTYHGLTLHAWDASYVIPAGLVVTKTFSPEEAFPGMNATVTVGVTNKGSQPLYNLSVGSGPDIFDQLVAGAASSKTFSDLGAGKTQSYNYGVTTTSAASGNSSASVVQTSMLFGGASVSIAFSRGWMIVYPPLQAQVSYKPTSPVENHDFTVTVKITNPSRVPLSSAVITLLVPAGVSVLNGSSRVANHEVSISFSSVPANSSQSASLLMSASMGVTISTNTASLVYHYQNATLQGKVPSLTITVSEDLTTRYVLPIVIAGLIAIAALVYMRRRIGVPTTIPT